jgi:hypothetical protein
MTPADVFFGRQREVESARSVTKRKTLKMRRLNYFGQKPEIAVS